MNGLKRYMEPAPPSQSQPLLAKQHSLQQITSIKSSATPSEQPAAVKSIDEDDTSSIDEAYFRLLQLKKADDFQIGYMILQYMVDEDELQDANVKTLLETDLAEVKKTYKCEDVEYYLELFGVKVINTWTDDQRKKYDWMVNNKYLKGLKNSAGKAVEIRDKAEAIKSTTEKLIGEATSSVEVGGGGISKLIELVIKTIAEKQLTNAMIEALKSSEPTTIDPKQRLIAAKGGVTNLNEGIGIMKGSICNEISLNSGLKYLKAGSVKAGSAEAALVKKDSVKKIF